MDIVGFKTIKKAIFPNKEKMPNPHGYIPFSFEKGMRKMSSDWLARKYVETFRIQPTLKLREHSKLEEKDALYVPSMSMCVQAQAKALTLILGDYEM